MAYSYRLDPNINTVLVGIEPLLKDGEPQLDRDDKPLSVASCVIPPSADEKVQTIEVRVPSDAVAKGLTAFTQVRFSDLTLRPWAFKTGDGFRSGVTMSASAVRPMKGSE